MALWSRKPLLSGVLDWPGQLYRYYRPVEATPETEDKAVRASKVKRVVMRVLNGSELAISWLPAFYYYPRWAAHGGGSVGEVLDVEGTRLHVRFDAEKHETPPMSWRTVFVRCLWPLLVPGLPPGINQAIHTLRLEGYIDSATGEVNLEFESEFVTTVFGRTAGKPLRVNAVLTSGESEGDVFHAVGERLRNGRATLVAVSRVPTSEDVWQNAILALPSDALSVLRVELDLLDD